MQKLINFFSTGPTLIGWIIGILKFESKSTLFKLSLQSMIIFLGYIFLLFINHFFSFLNLFNYSHYVYYIDSILATLYLIFSIKNYLSIQHPQKLLSLTQKLIVYVNSNEVE